MSKTFSDAFNEHLASTGAKVTDIAGKSGVKPDALYSLKYGKSRNMNVEDAIRVAQYFGETVEQFMGLAPGQVRDTLVEQIAQLSPREQKLLEVSLASILAAPGGEETEATPDKATAEPPGRAKGD